MIDFAFLDNRLEWTEILAGMDGEVKIKLHSTTIRFICSYDVS